MSRAFILVMDSFGIGASADADKFGDTGANTLGHIAAGHGLQLPNLARLGLARAAGAASGGAALSLGYDGAPSGAWGYAAEQSLGKDTPSGHWEIAGLPVTFEWGFFPNTQPCFPGELIDQLIARCDLPGILGNKHASGTEIIAELGAEHIRTGKPICYTSADSVFQIAAHEEHFGLQRLYDLCTMAKQEVDALNIARVIARPFLGEDAATFKRTANRKDLTTPPPGETLLDRLLADGGEVVSVGKIGDIFGHRGISRTLKAADNMALFDVLLQQAEEASEHSLIFTNFVDFDMLYGHRRDVAGYAHALQAFDARLPEFLSRLRPGDLALITADHGCDPTFRGTDHTREHVPVLFFGPGVGGQALGGRNSFADMGQTIAAHLGLAPLAHGEACL
ncbi:MAG: phosphopentomutase [Rhodospirillaceae bacterium]|jgi:phosphopentomutase|nr:phosphopentomutase [Rhodospirillaceae bacterium]MBT3494565.1 phosphopentomutase [Rhodospirillaceae bacterium]MBT3782656.1 phosphopentomutase [Rhodospirillaceae bacterium]MBT3974871.1 phosphopentomutase [Rhodospirillaceae bacterium]MBT4171401.1 phosphopentomutase [Rhodospirillaceae bacterium]